MPIDIRQFYQGFFDEVCEHLQNLENGVMALDVSAPDAEHVAALFRIAHSIKGTSATFGFSSMSTLTHALETMLDRVRQGKLQTSESLVDVVLRTRDVLQAQVEAFRSNSAVDGEAAKRLEAELLSFGAASVASAQHTFEVTYESRAFGSERERRFAELCESLASVSTVVSSPGSAVEPFWRFTLNTPAAEQELRAICGFGASAEDAVQIVNAAHGRRIMSRSQEAEQTEAYGFFEPLRAEETVVADAAAASAPLPNSADSEAATIRVRLDKVERLINLAGQMIVTTSTLVQSATRLDPLLHAPLVNSVDALQRQTRELREGVMSVRMMQVASLFARYTRVVRETAQKLGKDAVLVTAGGDTELDKGLIEQIGDPLVHLVRNAVDHGIELPHEREAGGKPARGTIRLCARHESGRVLIEVSDDGRGLQREKILAKAAQLGIEVAADADDATVWRLIFAPGFSTAAQVSDVSGRGVGMDVVQHNITRLGGRVEVSSEEGKGTRVTLSVPLTLAIIDGLAVSVDDQGYIIPIESIIESFSLKERRSSMILDSRAVEFRGSHVPLVSLGSGAAPASREVAVIVETEGRRAAICVDELQGQYQVVVKSLEENFRRVDGLIGASVMGSGKIAFIVDVPAIVR